MILEEKRAFKRVKRKFTIRYKRQEPFSPGGVSFSENISLGGVYFQSLSKFNIGDIIECSIKMPGVPAEGKWTARVVRCENIKEKMINTFGIAAEFIKSFGDSEKNLKKILDKVS